MIYLQTIMPWHVNVSFVELPDSRQTADSYSGKHQKVIDYMSGHFSEEWITPTFMECILNGFDERVFRQLGVLMTSGWRKFNASKN